MLPNHDGDDNTVFGVLHATTVTGIHEDAMHMAPAILPEYEAELMRAKRLRVNGRPTQSSYLIDESWGELLGERILNAVHQKPWGANAYWLLQIRGVKDGRRRGGHTQPSELSRALLAKVNKHQAHVFLDVAIELHPPQGWGVVAKRATLEAMLCDLLGINEDDYHGGSEQIDVWAGVDELAGVRVTFPTPVGAADISYVQVYTSDKAALYNAALEEKIPTVPALPIIRMANADTPLPMPAAIYTQLHSCQQNAQPIILRIEARVPEHLSDFVFDDTVGPQDIRPFVTICGVSYLWCVDHRNCCDGHVR